MVSIVPSFGPFIAGTDFTIDMTVIDEDGEAVVLTGATVVTKVETLFASEKNMSLVDAGANGVIRLVVTDTESAVAHGTYDGEVKITESGGEIRKAKYRINIRDTGF